MLLRLLRTPKWNRSPVQSHGAITAQIIRVNEFAAEFHTFVSVHDSLHLTLLVRELPRYHCLLVNRTVRAFLNGGYSIIGLVTHSEGSPSFKVVSDSTTHGGAVVNDQDSRFACGQSFCPAHLVQSHCNIAEWHSRVLRFVSLEEVT